MTEKQISESAMDKLKRWTWPGNIRELHNALERAILTSSSRIISQKDIHISGESKKEDFRCWPGMTVDEVERILILKTLDFSNQNRSQAAYNVRY